MQLFEEQFPSSHALDTVPKGLSVACSTPEAVEWDPEWRNLHEISGRAIKVHASSSLFTSMDGEMQGHEGGNGASGETCWMGGAWGGGARCLVTGPYLWHGA